jgi:steroid-22-oyl-CoA synthetase
MSKQMQNEAWLCADPVYAWRGRGEVTYRLMSDEDKHALEAEFFASGRQRLLPRPADAAAVAVRA